MLELIKVVSSTSGFTIGTSPYSASLRKRRKAAASALNKRAVTSYDAHISRETQQFIRDAYELGEKGKKALDPLALVQHLSLNLSLTLNWGSRIASVHDPLFQEIAEVEEYVSRFRSTTGNMQDYVPLLRWWPFNTASARAREMRTRRDVYIRRFNRELQQRLKNGEKVDCIQANVMAEESLDSQELMSLSLTMVAGGLDTITTLVSWALLLLAHKPDIQNKAYLAIKEHRMSTNDATECAYMVALVRELLRMYPPLRLALPRETASDFCFNDKLIPAGTVVVLNAWACNMDPEVYPDAHVFKPERFLDSNGRVQPGSIFTYGQGSRMCPGYILGNRELYMLFSRLLYLFEIKLAAGGSDADPLTGVADPTSLVSAPKEYKVIFSPRDRKQIERMLSEK